MNSIAAGILAHAGYHNDQRKLKKPYTAKEEKDAKVVGKNMEEIWDQHQSDNKIATVAQAQAFLDHTHAQINNLFPTGKKPFPLMYRPLNR